MLVDKHYLYKDRQDVYFTSYILDDSAEYQTGKKRPCVLICPGGGYVFISDREGEPIAMRFLAHGYCAFVLHYSVSDGSRDGVFFDALYEAALAVKTIRENADKWHIDGHKLAMIGFSAGAHLSASFASYSLGDELKNKVAYSDLSPQAVVLSYPWLSFDPLEERFVNNGEITEDTREFMPKANSALSGKSHPTDSGDPAFSPLMQVTGREAPMFIWHTSEDSLIYVDQSLKYARALAAKGAEFELHIFEKGTHGLSLANEVTKNNENDVNDAASVWPELMFSWLSRHIVY